MTIASRGGQGLRLRAVPILGIMVAWPASPAAVGAQSLPEAPAISPDVIGVPDGRFAHGHISAERSSQDGRLKLSRRGFLSSRPEVFFRTLAGEGRGSDSGLAKVSGSTFHASTLENPVLGHVAICDPYLADGVARNPYACFHGGRHADCYDVSVIQVVQGDVPGSALDSELWSTPVTVKVRNPKTRTASIARIERRGPPRRSPIASVPKRAGTNLLEPIVSGDGRLLVLNSGDTLLYSVMGPAAMPCDARNWTRLTHVSRMHRDSAMKRYGLAVYPFRDSENRRIKPGRPIRGAYPWIDREGKNLFFTQVGGTGLFYRNSEGKLESRFEVLNRPKKRQIRPIDATRFAVSYAGLWSQGKIVVPDLRVNNVDFDLGKKGYRPRVRLYADQPEGLTIAAGTTTRINSPQNEWNYLPALLPRSPRDVVWWLSANNDMTGEVVFDDVLDVGSLIFSPMNAAVNNKKRAYRDGFDDKKKLGYTKTPRVQNSAASELRWKIPSFGALVGARIEPIAAGGRVGKGVWLEGSRGRLEYAVPEQSDSEMERSTWTTTIWLDSRGSSERQRLLTFPDGSWLDLEQGRIIFGGGPSGETAVPLPAAHQPRARRWTHLGLVSTVDTTSVFVDGFKLGSWSGTYLRLREGRLIVGRSVDGSLPGFRGWIDEFRVVAGIRNPETMCNFAYGTLRGLDPVADAADYAAAAAFPQASHDEISALLETRGWPSYSRYRCETKRDSSPSCLDTIHLPGGTAAECVRAGVLFPEGPLVYDLPRPDSRGNSFCRTCHANGHPTRALQIGRPLRSGGTATLVEDPRRQPSQAPRALHGFIPKSLLGLPEDVEAPPEGLLLDQLLYPGSGDVDVASEDNES